MQWTGLALMLLFTHAIAKALLFMSVGAVIITTNNQNLTEMGGALVPHACNHNRLCGRGGRFSWITAPGGILGAAPGSQYFSL